MLLRMLETKSLFCSTWIKRECLLWSKNGPKECLYCSKNEDENVWERILTWPWGVQKDTSEIQMKTFIVSLQQDYLYRTLLEVWKYCYLIWIYPEANKNLFSCLHLDTHSNLLFNILFHIEYCIFWHMHKISNWQNLVPRTIIEKKKQILK